MALDETQRKALQEMVRDARKLLTDEFTAQLQEQYGIQPDGTITDPKKLGHLDDEQYSVAEKLRERIIHLASGEKNKKALKHAVEREVREQAFTVLNRFAALRMAEERGLVQECVRQGYNSKGFRVFDQIAGPSMGDTYDRYVSFLFCLFDELALDLGVLFDRYSPYGMLFPRPKALEELLDLINIRALKDAWAEDEAIGWTYQYFNSKEEIREMRDKGRSGPRNSSEMAVRNQFFTPHYVVQFLVDNTLGRLWVEMTRGDTDLPQYLQYYAKRSNEYFLGEGDRVPDPPDKEVTYVPYRPKKDPREIRLLDPACGSMHFGLYAFDVYEHIYLEAWDRHTDLLQDLREKHDRTSFLRLVPRLILEYNLHGIDIDPRAVQIAGLALWLRAQKSWKRQNVRAEDRPRIRRSHLVCAEPMPGGEDLLTELRADLERRNPTNGKLLGELVAEAWERMQLAGEAGPLLKIEQELEGAIERAKKAAETARQTDIFGDAEDDETEFSVQGISRRFFYGEGPLPKVLAALRDLATSSEGADGYRRRLFEEDAAQGLAFIEILRQQFDVVVMNPPFGDPSINSKSYIEDVYTDTKNDILQAFVERAGELLVSGGYLGAITSRTPFFLSSAQAWRERVVLRLFKPQLMADFGMGVLDAMVETAAYVLRSLTVEEDRALTLSLVPDLMRVERNKNGTFSVPKYMKARSEDLKRHQAERELERLVDAGLIFESVVAHGRSFELLNNAIKRAQAEHLFSALPPPLICFRIIGESDRIRSLLEAINDTDDLRRFEADSRTFSDVPGAPFAYWVSNRVRKLFRELPPFESEGRRTVVGLQTSDDFRFLRLWWEVPSNEVSRPDYHPAKWIGPYCVAGAKWFPFAKGGSFSPYYADLHLVVNWNKSGLEIKEYVSHRYPYLGGNSDYVVKDRGDYFRPGLTWPRRTNGLSFRPLQHGSVFADKGSAAIIDSHEEKEILTAAGLMNSRAFDVLTQTMVARVDLAQSFEVGLVAKVPFISLSDVPSNLSSAALLAHDLKISAATRNELKHPFILPHLAQGGYTTIADGIDKVNVALFSVDEKLADLQNQIDSTAFDLYGFLERDRKQLASVSERIELQDNEGEADTPEIVNPQVLVHDLVSYIFGIIYGRWDIRYAVGNKYPPPNPAPFAPLPVCPPGMLQDETTGLPLNMPPSDYPVNFVTHGIVVDDEAHSTGLLSRIREVFCVLYRDRATIIEQESAEILGRRTLEDYFRHPNAFFEAHLKQYSKSRRKAPIYWPLSVPSGKYTLWIYYPRLSNQTLYTAINDFVDPKLSEISSDIERLRGKVFEDGDRKQKEQLDDLIELHRELQEFRSELLRVAKLPYKPNLNDGVELTAAPLWKLFQHTQWQRHLKKRWEQLESADYDWAHIAYSIWPDRVREACRKDKSIAIAHGLEELYEEVEAD